MKYLYYFLIFCALIVVGSVAGLAIRLHTVVPSRRLEVKLASELNPSDPGYKKVMCGPFSLSVALGRLGVSIAPSEIASQCRVTSYGVALTDLERVAANLPTVRAVARKLNWEELRAVDGVAVLFVKGDHFVAADLRDNSPGTDKTTTIRVYDQEIPARGYLRAELEKIWSGETLIVTRQQTSSDLPSDAHIAWDECYIDKGVVADSSIARFKFSFRNLGTKDLLVESIETSCGCMKHKLSTKQLAPGESAQIEVDVNLDAKEGYIRQHVVVGTNDPATPVSFLNMACWIPRKWPVSTQAIRLEDLPQGSNVRQDFVVADPGFVGIKIQDAKFLLPGRSGSVDDLSCSISWEMIGDDAKKVGERTGFSASPGDYLVRLSFDADNVCPVGPFEGSVVVTVEADGSVATHKVDIQGMIVQDVHSIPQMALITLGPDLESVGSATIQLHSRTNRKIRVLKAWSDNSHSLEIRPESGLQNNYVVTARMPDLVVGTAPFKGTAVFELDSGSVVSVPVTVFRPPHGVEKVSRKTPIEAGKK